MGRTKKNKKTNETNKKLAYLPIHKIRSVRDERGSGERRAKITDRSELLQVTLSVVTWCFCVTRLVFLFFSVFKFFGLVFLRFSHSLLFWGEFLLFLVLCVSLDFPLVLLSR